LPELRRPVEEEDEPWPDAVEVVVGHRGDGDHLGRITVFPQRREQCRRDPQHRRSCLCADTSGPVRQVDIGVDDHGDQRPIRLQGLADRPDTLDEEGGAAVPFAAVVEQRVPLLVTRITAGDALTIRADRHAGQDVTSVPSRPQPALPRSLSWNQVE